MSSQARNGLNVVTATGLLLLVFASGCGGQDRLGPTAEATNTPAVDEGEPDALVVLSGRRQKLIEPLVKQFHEETGIAVRVDYGETAELAMRLLEEDPREADLFLAQDAAALATAAPALEPLPAEILDQVEPQFRGSDGRWIGVSGRMRVLAFNPDRLAEADLPESVGALTQLEWKGRIGWAPTNGSFQAYVTALRILEGDEAAAEWVKGMQANAPKVYSNNTEIVRGVAAGEIDVGLVNHYNVLKRLAEEDEPIPVQSRYPTPGETAAIVHVAGAGIVQRGPNRENALKFLRFLLSATSQRYFAQELYEYPLAGGVRPDERLVPIEKLDPPQIDLSDLEDLPGTLELLKRAGALPRGDQD